MKDIIPFLVYTVFVTKTNTQQRMVPYGKQYIPFLNTLQLL